MQAGYLWREKMSEGIAIIIGAGIALLASVATTIMQGYLGNKKAVIKDYIEQFASFYELEKLYIDEIARLRYESGADGSDKKKAIKDSFRQQNEADSNNAHISLTSRKARDFLRHL